MNLLPQLMCVCLLLSATSVSAAPLQLLISSPKELDAKSVRAINSLLGDRWERSNDNDQRSKVEFLNAPHGNPHVLNAYILNRLRHGKARDAIPFSTEVRQRFKTNWDGALLEAWLLALTDQYEASLVRMGAMKRRLVAAEAANILDATAKQKIYARLGRLLGYLEGPVQDKLNPQLLAQISTEIESDLDPDSENAFSSNRTAVKVKHREVLNAHAQFNDAELARVSVANEIERQQLDQDNRLAQETRERLQPQLDQLSESASSTSSLLEQQILNAASELEALNRAGFQLEQDLAFLYADLYSIDPRFRRGYNFNVIAIEDQIYRTAIQLNQVRNSAFNQASNLAALRNQLTATRSRYGRQINSLQSQLSKTEAVQKRNNRKLKKIAMGPKIANGKRSAMRDRRMGLKKYDDLSIELYRQEFLEAIN